MTDTLSLEAIISEWESKIPPSPTLTLLAAQLYRQAGEGNAAGVRTILSCLVRLQHLGTCKLPADVAQAVEAFSK